MGNCIIKESSMQWGGDDWSDDYSDHLTGRNPKKINLYNHNYTYKKIVVEEEEEDSGASKTDVNTQNMQETRQVKLRITRKQLEELMTESTTNIKGVSVEQVLEHLINVGMHDEFDSHQNHSWRPDLPTITEV